MPSGGYLIANLHLITALGQNASVSLAASASPLGGEKKGFWVLSGGLKNIS